MDIQAADLVTSAALSPTDLLSLWGLVVASIAISAGAIVFFAVCWLSARARAERWRSTVVH